MTMCMTPVIFQFWNHAFDAESGFRKYYQLAPNHDWEQSLCKFLFSTMDEVRQRHARAFSKLTLALYDVEDADHFRQGVLRREASGDMAYPKQRDHSAHTVNNWLLGWYIYDHCAGFRSLFKEHAARRGISGPDEWHGFGDQWQFVSLLHDVGYLFEGSINSLDPGLHSRQAHVGISVVKDYFFHRLWLECRFGSIIDRDRLLKLAKVDLPDFSNATTMTGIADSLRSLGSLEEIRQAIHGTKRFKSPYIGESGGLPGDAFDLWQRHYESFGAPRMTERVKAVQGVFEAYLYEGIDGAGMRVLDHGVCSGLLLLLFSTFYNRIRQGIGESEPSDTNQKRIWKLFRRDDDRGIDYDPTYWWGGVVWATAATAIHNIQQLPGPVWPGNTPYPGKLTLADDPLAYLGILVDCIQEWDRYTVTREAFVGGGVPAQGIDIWIGASNEKVTVRFDHEKRAKKAKESLDDALEGWGDLIVIEPLPQSKDSASS